MKSIQRLLSFVTLITGTVMLSNCTCCRRGAAGGSGEPGAAACCATGGVAKTGASGCTLPCCSQKH